MGRFAHRWGGGGHIGAIATSQMKCFQFLVQREYRFCSACEDSPHRNRKASILPPPMTPLLPIASVARYFLKLSPFRPKTRPKTA